jgi:hypothetical protein
MKFKFELEDYGVTHTVEGDAGDWATYDEVAQQFANLISGAYGYTITVDTYTENGKPLTEERLWDKFSEQEEEPVKKKKCKAKCE